ncbi:hypothetical protein [Kitasatospora sp. NPDC091207]|uniref:hypothetical protein n=1 Tax=Kitasatospora sp. NPDC091207 TaxID=3364083 RepID=UPI0037FF97FE
MTALDQTATDLPPSGAPANGATVTGVPAVDVPPVDVLAVSVTGTPDGHASCGASPGSPASAGAPGSGAPARTASRCTMAATAGDRAPTGSTRDGSVPRPRGDRPAAENGRDHGDDAADGGVGGLSDRVAGAFDESGQTAARIRAGLAARLRTAHGQGRSLAELAAACRRPVAEIRALLAEDLGAAAAGPVAGSGSASATGAEPFVLFQPPPSTPAEERTVPVLRAARAELRTVLSRRPSPSRRLRRMHPETAGPDRPQATPRADAAAAAPVPSSPAPDEPTASDPPVGTVGPAAGDAAGGDAETPLGILIGGTPHLPEAVGRPEERQPVRVAAEPVRIGRGTSLVILPAWRPAIAVSVSTDHLLSATGLAVDQLADAQLSVLINPGALHDRELDLHGWQAGPAGRTGRAGGRKSS